MLTKRRYKARDFSSDILGKLGNSRQALVAFRSTSGTSKHNVVDKLTIVVSGFIKRDNTTHNAIRVVSDGFYQKLRLK